MINSMPSYVVEKVLQASMNPEHHLPIEQQKQDIKQSTADFRPAFNKACDDVEKGITPYVKVDEGCYKLKIEEPNNE